MLLYNGNAQNSTNWIDVINEKHTEGLQEKGIYQRGRAQCFLYRGMVDIVFMQKRILGDTTQPFPVGFPFPFISLSP